MSMTNIYQNVCTRFWLIKSSPKGIGKPFCFCSNAVFIHTGIFSLNMYSLEIIKSISLLKRTSSTRQQIYLLHCSSAVSVAEWRMPKRRIFSSTGWLKKTLFKICLESRSNFPNTYSGDDLDTFSKQVLSSVILWMLFMLPGMALLLTRYILASTVSLVLRYRAFTDKPHFIVASSS